jgi:cysteine desulfurase / selenocysteine lyase
MSTAVFNIEKARADTPITQSLIHFNNAGASLMPEAVLNASVDYLRLETHIGAYEAYRQEKDTLNRAYTSLAHLINAQPDEIALIENATRAWDLVFYSIPFAKGDKIITAHAEYGSNYIPFLQISRKYGVEIVAIPDDEHGQLDVNALENAIDERVKLIAITHVPSTGGLINPAEAVGVIAKKHGILYLLDACQSVGQLVVDVQKIGCDFMSVTGRKFLRAPRGTGFLYARREAYQRMEPVFLDTHAALWVAQDRYEIDPTARRFETWESGYALRAGLAIATDYALSWGMEAIQARVQALAQHLRSQLRLIKGVTVQDMGIHQCGIVTFSIEGRDSYAIRDELLTHHINVSVSPKEYTLLDFEARGLPSLVRASVHYFNTEGEIARFCEVLAGK